MDEEPHKDDLNSEAYWAHRPLNELLAIAHEYSERAYSGLTGGALVFEMALDHFEPGLGQGADIVVMDKASRIHRTMAELRQDVRTLTGEKDT